MKQIFHIWLTVHVKPEDDEEKVKENLFKFLPFDLEKEKIKITRTTATSFEERKIRILQVHLEKDRHIARFVKLLNEVLNPEQKLMLRIQRESRLDSDNHFFIRIDKDILINENRFFITDFGNCYHIKMSIAAFPTTRDNALDMIEKIFPREEKESENTA